MSFFHLSLYGPFKKWQTVHLTLISDNKQANYAFNSVTRTIEVFIYAKKKDKENDYIIHRGLVYQGTYSALLAYQHMP